MHGRAHKRIFHFVAINQRARRDGKPAEILGIYNPHVNPGDDHKTIEWSVDRIRYWLHVGAVPSKSVVKLLELVSFGALYNFHPVFTYSLREIFLNLALSTIQRRLGQCQNQNKRPL
jgi:ribosomal protein S16